MFRNKNGQVRSGWVMIVVSVLLLITELIFSFPGVKLFKVVTGEQLPLNEMIQAMSQYPWMELLTNGGPVLGGILLILCLWRLIHKRRLTELGLVFSKQGMQDLLAGLLFGVMAMTAIFGFLLLTGSLTIEPGIHISTQTMTYLILFILVGFFEEIFFRGYLMSILTIRGNPKWAVHAVSALTFAAFHLSNPNVSLIGLVNIALVGLLFSVMYDLTKNLWMPIGYHITWNYFQGNVYGFPVSGTDPYGLFSVQVEAGRDWLTGGAFGPEAGILATVITILFFLFTRLYVIKQKRDL